MYYKTPHCIYTCIFNLTVHCRYLVTGVHLGAAPGKFLRESNTSAAAI